METVSKLPDPFTQRLEVALNDQEFHIVARNAIMILFILTLDLLADNPSSLADVESLIHLWYSASLTSDTMAQLRSRVKPLLSAVCQDILAGSVGTIVEKTWLFSHNKSLRLVLKQEDWFKVEALCEVPSDLTQQKAHDIRTSITLAPERRDYRDRWYFKDAAPSVRVLKQKFREDGLLLPFGHNRMGFDIPNP